MLQGPEQVRLPGWAYHFDLYLNFQGFKAHARRNVLDSLVADVYPASMSGFGQADSPEFCADVSDHVLMSDALLVCRLGAQAVAFASFYDLREHDTLFLNGIAVHTDHHGQQIGRRSIDCMLGHIERGRLAFTTQNPCMYELARTVSRTVLPDRSGTPVPVHEHEYCAVMLKGRRGVHDAETSVVTGLYGSCLYPSIPVCKNADTDQWFCDRLLVDERRETCNGMLVVGILK